MATDQDQGSGETPGTLVVESSLPEPGTPPTPLAPFLSVLRQTMGQYARKEGRAPFDSQFENMTHHGGEGVVVGV